MTLVMKLEQYLNRSSTMQKRNPIIEQNSTDKIYTDFFANECNDTTTDRVAITSFEIDRKVIQHKFRSVTIIVEQHYPKR